MNHSSLGQYFELFYSSHSFLFLIYSEVSEFREDSKSGGHLGCSSGYNFNIYKEYTSGDVDGAKNSQGWEQMHSTLTKLSKSLSLMNYSNFQYDNFFCDQQLAPHGQDKRYTIHNIIWQSDKMFHGSNPQWLWFSC